MIASEIVPNLVSIYVPNYNGARWIAETIQSVQAQTYTAWEMIIVDDCSTDNSVDIIRNYQQHDPRIQLICLPTRSGGPARPRNVALDNARGEYVASLDNDDLWHPQKLELQLHFMKQTNTPVSSTAQQRFVDMREIQDSMQTVIDKATVSYRYITHDKLLRRHLTPHLLAERRVFEGIRFIEDPEYVAVEDYLCWLQIHQYKVAQSIKLTTPLMFYRQASTSISARKLRMLRKNHRLYSAYRINGNALGWKVWFYLGVYVVRSSINRLAMFLKLPSLNTIDY
jgi:teichuronic acid biosynthesis glycosyltransferase TuaG